MWTLKSFSASPLWRRQTQPVADGTQGVMSVLGFSLYPLSLIGWWRWRGSRLSCFGFSVLCFFDYLFLCSLFSLFTTWVATANSTNVNPTMNLSWVGQLVMLANAWRKKSRKRLEWATIKTESCSSSEHCGKNHFHHQNHLHNHNHQYHHLIRDTL